MNKRHPLDELFSQHLRDATAPVSGNMWDRIAQARQKKRRRLMVVWSSVGTAIVGLIALAVLLSPSAEPELGYFPLQGNGIPGVQSAPLATAQSADLSLINSVQTNMPGTAKSGKNTAAARTILKNEYRNRGQRQQKRSALASRTASRITVEEPIAPLEELAPSQPILPQNENDFKQNSEEESSRISGPHQRDRSSVVALLPEKNTVPTEQTDLKLFANHAPRCADFASPFFRVDLEMLGGPAYAQQTLHAKTSESSTHLNRRKESESAGLSYTSGFRLAASSSVGLGLRTGLMYTQINDRFTFEAGSRMDVSIIFGSNGEVIGRDTVYTEAFLDQRQNRLKFVEIPLLLGYETQVGKFRVGLNAGAYLNVYFGAKGSIYSPATGEPIAFGQQGDRDVLPIFDRRATAAMYAGMSIAYNLRSRYSLIAEPYFKTYPKALSSSAYNLQQNYWMTGVQLGLRMRL